MPERHSPLGPSGAQKWMNCPGSVALEQGYADKSSVYANEGTLAHKLAEIIINYNAGNIPKATFKKELDNIKSDPMYNQSMQDNIDEHVSRVWEQANTMKECMGDVIVLTEQELNYSAYVPDGFGTADVVLISPGIICIIDLKYGKGKIVDAEDNPQLRLYGLGAIEEYSMLYDFSVVKMMINQVQLDRYVSAEMQVDELLEYGEKVIKPAAELALSPDAPCIAGPWCDAGFCKAKKTCRARAEKNLELAKYEFADGRALNADEIADILAKADELASWAKDIQDFALTDAVTNGTKYNGWKLVEGRSNRKYADEEAVVSTLTSAGYDEAILYERKLLGITAMEGTVGKKKFAELLKDLIVKPEGKPVLVPETDKRPELNSTSSAANDFDEALPTS